MSAASKKTIRKLMPFGVILAFAALLGVARGSVGGYEFNVAIGPNFVDPNNYILFQTNVGGVVNTVEVGTTLQFTLGATNNTTAATKFYFGVNGAILDSHNNPVAAGSGPALRFACMAGGTYQCPVNGLASAYDFPYLDATNALPGTYTVSFTATDANTNAVSYSPTYSFVVSSPAGALVKNSLSANTLMTITITSVQTIFAAPGGSTSTANAAKTDSTTSTTNTTLTTATTGAFASPVTLILNNVGTSTIVVYDQSGDTVTLGAGDVIAAQFLSTVQAKVIEGVPGSLRIGLP
jgi:hypothetical protein